MTLHWRPCRPAHRNIANRKVLYDIDVSFVRCSGTESYCRHDVVGVQRIGRKAGIEKQAYRFGCVDAEIPEKCDSINFLRRYFG